jgi:hypothetical protein
MIILLVLATTGAVVVTRAAPASSAITASTWYSGPSAGSLYDANFHVSDTIPWTLTEIPQGAATLLNGNGNGHDAILISTYHEADDTQPSYLLALDAANGTFIAAIPIAATHAGGLAVTSDWVYVSSGSTVRRYTVYEVRKRQPGAGPHDCPPNGAHGGWHARPIAGRQVVGRRALPWSRCNTDGAS